MSQQLLYSRYLGHFRILCLGKYLIFIYLLYLGTADDPLADISEVLNTDDDILGIISDDLAKSVDHSGIHEYCLPDFCFVI